LKRIVTILLIVSLYSPQIAQFLSYSNCAILASFNVDISLCDCLKKSTTTYHTTDGFLNTEIKSSTAQHSWNFTADNNFDITLKPIIATTSKQNFYYNLQFPNTLQRLVFRPPC
jgi:hypothetical protein